MTIYQFSALFDGQVISFVPTVDVLNFDDVAISAADLHLSTDTDLTNLFMIVASGPHAGKGVVLQSTSPQQLSVNNITFADGSRLLFGDASSSGQNDNAANTLTGTVGADLIAGLGGNDTVSGGDGDDVFILASGTAADYGADSINGGNGFDLLDFRGATGSAVTVNISATGTVSGGGSNGSGSATLASIEGVIGSVFNDQLIGGGANNLLVGGPGRDTLDGSSGNDTLRGGRDSDSLRGGPGNDQFVFAEAPNAFSADQVRDFATNVDKLVLDQAAFADLGAPGNFAAGDARFFAAAGASAGHDADDRVVYNTTTGQLFYDADGNGSGTSQLIATLLNAPAVSATDISVTGEEPPPSGNQATAGNDSLTGTEANDSIAGLGGNDTIEGLGGNDTLDGGPGVDLLFGGDGVDTLVSRDVNASGVADTLDGGLGDDIYDLRTEQSGDQRNVLIDAGGVDIVLVGTDPNDGERNFTLPTGIENLTMFSGFEQSFVGTGNAANNVIKGASSRDELDGGDGNDTLMGFADGDIFFFRAGSGEYGHDVVDGGKERGDEGEGPDTMSFEGARSAVTLDMQAGTATGGGTGGSGSVTFTEIEVIVGSPFDDRLISTDGVLDGGRRPSLSGAQGNDTLIGGSGSDFLSGGGGNDEIHAGAGDDTLSLMQFFETTYGNDTLDGGDGTDLLTMSMLEPGTSAAFIDLSAGLVRGGGLDGEGRATLVGIEDILVRGDTADTIIGNAAANLIVSSSSNQSDDTIRGGGGNDQIELHDSFEAPGVGVEVYGEDGNDTITSSFSGSHVLNGGAGNDSLAGGAGADNFLFAETPGSANADVISGFVSGTDTIVLDPAAHANLGAGNFTLGDSRFASGAGFTSGRDASDRVVYNTSTGQLFYDTDGSGAGAAQLIATLQGAPVLAATDIDVLGAPVPSQTQGTAGNDSLTGTAGDDLLEGLAGNDTLRGLAGNDTLDAGTGADVLIGGTGNDAYIVDGPGDTVTENVGEGTDTVLSSASRTLDANVENLTLTGTAQIDGTGNALNNVINGNSSSNRLNGGSGADTLFGGLGNDIFIVDGAGDTVLENPGSGADRVESSVSRTLDPNVEDLTLTGSAAINGTGNELANTIVGNSAANRLAGGLGDDTYHVGAGDTVVEIAGEGIDTVFSTVSRTLEANVENLFLAAGAVNGTGNALNNSLIGNGAANSLVGGDGNDSLSGGGGLDTLNGGLGNDLYEVRGGEVLLDGGGVDLVAAFVDWTLGGSFENLTAAGAASVRLTGNANANLITGNFSSNIVSGGGGNDTLRGGGGNDSLHGGSGNDRLEGNSGNDTLTGGIGVDHFVFLQGPAVDGVDRITDFVSGSDELLFENAAFTALGASGAWAAGDGRFRAGAGVTSGRDSSDRLVYNTSTGDLYYDADGSGAGAAQLVATLGGAPALAATDITVI